MGKSQQLSRFDKQAERRTRNESIAIELRRLRDKSGLSRQEICGHLGITTQRYQQWEDAYSQPSLQMFADICRLHGLTTTRQIFSNFGL